MTANSVEVEDLVRTGPADLGFIESPLVPTGLSQTTIRTDALGLVVAPAHPWAALGEVTMDEVADAELVAREEGSGTRQTWEAAVREHLGRDAAPPAVVLPTSAAVRSAVAEGLAPALLSRLAVADDVRLGRLAEVTMAGPPIVRPISALWRGMARDLTPTSRELLEVAVDEGANPGDMVHHTQPPTPPRMTRMLSRRSRSDPGRSGWVSDRAPPHFSVDDGGFSGALNLAASAAESMKRWSLMVTVIADLAGELRSLGLSNVSSSDVDRAAYSSDASLFRVVPQVVVRAEHVDDLHAVHEAARRLGVLLTLRGSGTSIAGNAIGPGIVVDTRALNRVIEIDPEARIAVVEPGVVHAELQRAAAPHGLRFGPDPSSHTRATIGGMIGNNACGSPSTRLRPHGRQRDRPRRHLGCCNVG